MVAPVSWSGHWWLVLASVIQSPSVFSVAMSMRYEFVLHLVKSFEFWFYSLVNVVWVGSLVFGYADSRCVALFFNMIEFEHAVLVDAAMQPPSFTFIAAIIGFSILAINFVGLSLGLIQVRDMVVMTTPQGHVLTIVDVITSVTATATLLVGRLVYRNRHSLRQRDRFIVQCTICRCHLQFVEVDLRSSDSTHSKTTHSSARIVPSLNLSVYQLEYVPKAHMYYYPANTLILRATKWDPSRRAQLCWKLSVVVALSMLVAYATGPPHNHLQTSRLHRWSLPVLLVTNAIAAIPFIALHHRQLLHQVVGSFDFAFATLLLTAAYMSDWYLHHWDVVRGVALACLWLWFYIASTYDALTPAAKRSLGWFSVHGAALVLLLLIMHVLMVVEVAVGGHVQVKDRLMFERHVLGHHIRVFATPFFFARMTIVIVWNSRLVWRHLVCRF